MAEPASSPAPDNPSVQDALAALDQHMKEMRRDLADTVKLIELLRESCIALKGKIDAAEREHARLVSRF